MDHCLTLHCAIHFGEKDKVKIECKVVWDATRQHESLFQRCSCGGCQDSSLGFRVLDSKVSISEERILAIKEQWLKWLVLSYEFHQSNEGNGSTEKLQREKEGILTWRGAISWS